MHGKCSTGPPQFEKNFSTANKFLLRNLFCVIETTKAYIRTHILCLWVMNEIGRLWIHLWEMLKWIKFLRLAVLVCWYLNGNRPAYSYFSSEFLPKPNLIQAIETQRMPSHIPIWAQYSYRNTFTKNKQVNIVLRYFRRLSSRVYIIHSYL